MNSSINISAYLNTTIENQHTMVHKRKNSSIEPQQKWFALQKTLLRGQKEKLKMGTKYL